MSRRLSETYSRRATLPASPLRPADRYAEYSALTRAEELAARIERHSDFTSADDRCQLLDEVDEACRLLQEVEKRGAAKAPYLSLATALVELAAKNTVAVPDRAAEFLAEAIDEARGSRWVEETEIVIPLLTLNLLSGDYRLEEEAVEILARAAARRDRGTATPTDHHVLALCSEYEEEIVPK